MEPSSGLTTPIEAELRESKDRIAIDTLNLCRDLHIRAMVGGDPVLAAHGLMTPAVSQNAVLFIDPASIRHLHTALLARGWIEMHRPGIHVLPPYRVVLRHPGERGWLSLYSIMPGFFADPEETFDRIWERHKEIQLRGVTVRALGRLTSAIVSSRDEIAGRVSTQRDYFHYFVSQFQILLSDRERDIVADLIHQFGACAEMSALLTALGKTPCAFTLPSVAYAQARLGVSDVSDQTRRALAILELAPHGRDMLYRSKTGRPRTFADLMEIITGLPATFAAVFGARRRVARALLVGE